MKNLFIVLSVVLLLSIASAGYSDRGDRHQRQRVRSDNDSTVIVKLFFGSGRYPDYRERRRHRYVEKHIYKERGPYGEKVVVKKKVYRRGYARPYWKQWRRHSNARDDWFERRRWPGRY